MIYLDLPYNASEETGPKPQKLQRYQGQVTKQQQNVQVYILKRKNNKVLSYRVIMEDRKQLLGLWIPLN